MKKQKNSLRNTTSQDRSAQSQEGKRDISDLSPPLTPSELESLKKDMTEASRIAQAHFKSKVVED